jgi:DNA polymerase III delta prime subunit
MKFNNDTYNKIINIKNSKYDDDKNNDDKNNDFSIIEKFNLLSNYYPKKLDEFIIDNYMIELLKTLIKIHDLNILLIGDTGTGKSRLIEIILNEYYGDNNLDLMIKRENILFINNLKEQNIHNFRQLLKIFCQTSFSYTNIKSQKIKKTVVIDDLDLLNIQNQQIIRHYIDKYSNKVNFLCTCSNIQNVLDNIQSRTMIFQLSYLNNDILYKFLTDICYKLNIKLDDECKRFILKSSNNSIKLLLKFMHKIIYLTNNDSISLNLIKTICNNISYDYFDKFFLYIKSNNINDDINDDNDEDDNDDDDKIDIKNNNLINKASSILLTIYNNGYSVIDILENMFYYIKNTTILDNDEKFIVMNYITKYINIFHSLHENEFELVLLTNELLNILQK